MGAQVAAGAFHTGLLRADGTALAFGHNSWGQCDIPALDGDVKYAQVAAGASHTVLLRTDGTALACGKNSSGQCRIPALDGDMKYVQTTQRYRVILQAAFRTIADTTVMQLFLLSGAQYCH